jgi:hypothetical protein
MSCILLHFIASADVSGASGGRDAHWKRVRHLPNRGALRASVTIAQRFADFFRSDANLPHGSPSATNRSNRKLIALMKFSHTVVHCLTAGLAGVAVVATVV